MGRHAIAEERLRRFYFSGVGSDPIPPGATVSIGAGFKDHPIVKLQLHRVLYPTNGPALVLHEIRVGDRTLSEDESSRLFADQDSGLSIDVGPSEDVVFVVENQGSAPAVFDVSLKVSGETSGRWRR